jgi:hypothetical protein
MGKMAIYVDPMDKTNNQIIIDKVRNAGVPCYLPYCYLQEDYSIRNKVDYMKSGFFPLDITYSPNFDVNPDTNEIYLENATFVNLDNGDISKNCIISKIIINNSTMVHEIEVSVCCEDYNPDGTVHYWAQMDAETNCKLVLSDKTGQYWVSYASKLDRAQKHIFKVSIISISGVELNGVVNYEKSFELSPDNINTFANYQTTVEYVNI